MIRALRAKEGCCHCGSPSQRCPPPPCSASRLNLVWRLSYGIGLIPIFFMLLWRLFRLKESKVWIRKRSSLKMMGE